MLIDPEIKEVSPIHLIGLSVTTSQAEDDPSELWKKFKPLITNLTKNPPSRFYSVQLYPKGIGMEAFTPNTSFEKWAAIEKQMTTSVPENLQTLVIPQGTYAIFTHHGTASSFPKTLQFIFGLWLPHSAYDLDARPHFEVMGPNYAPTDPEASEEVWIPIKKRM